MSDQCQECCDALDCRVDAIEENLTNLFDRTDDLNSYLSTLQCVVRTEEELRAALLVGCNILIPDVFITITKRIVTTVAGTSIRGLSRSRSGIKAADTYTDDRMVLLTVPDVTISELTFDGGFSRVSAFNLDGFSRPASRNTLSRLIIKSVFDGINLSGGAGSSPSGQFQDFTVKECRITDFDHGGIVLVWELVRLRLQDLYIWGNGDRSVHNCIWVGNGMVDCHITNCVLGNVQRNGIEIYYAAEPTSYTTISNPYGACVTVSGIAVANANTGASFAGCRRSSITGITTRNTLFIGSEFIDEKPGRCNLTASGITAANAKGTAISVDQIDGFSLSNFVIDGVIHDGGAWRGIYMQLCDDITISGPGSLITNAGERYIMCNNNTRVNILGVRFVAIPGENNSVGGAGDGGNFAMYLFATDAFLSGNIYNGNATNQLRVGVNTSPNVLVSPAGVPEGLVEAISDAFNLRR